MSWRTFFVLSLTALLVGCAPEPTTPNEEPIGRVSDPVAVISGSDLRALVGEMVVLDGSGSLDAVSYRWDFGDGNGTAHTANPVAEHAYQEPGHYLLALEVLAPDGRPDVSSTRVTVSWPRSTQRVTRANVLDFDWDEDSILMVATDYDAVAAVRTSDGAVSHWFDTCPGPSTLSHSRSPEQPNALFVACPEADIVEVWDTANQTRRGQLTLPRGSQPYSVVAPTRGTSGWVALQGTGEVVEIISPLNGTPVLGRTLEAVHDPRGLALVHDRLLVARHRSPDAEAQWVSIDLSTDVVSEYQLARSPGPDSDTTSRGVPSYLQQIGVSPDGRVAWFPSLQANVERGLWREGRPLTHENTVRAVLSSVALNEEETLFSGLEEAGAERDRVVLDDRGLASAVSFSPEGDWVYVGFLGMESITVLDAYTRQASGSVPGLTGGVEGLITSTDGARLFAGSRIGRALWEIDLADGGLPSVSRTIDLTRKDVPDPIAEDVRQGRLIFQRSADPRMTQDGYVSCASCHLDGTHDGRTWDFTDRGEGLRNTISLRGPAGIGHGPMHWSANFDEVQDFEHDVRGPQAGAGFLLEPDWELTQTTLGPPKAGLSVELDALAAYVGSLNSFPRSPWRAEDGELTMEAEAGELIFHDPVVGCAECHPAPRYTDSQWLGPSQPLLNDVGTLTEGSGQRLSGELLGLDTPTLLALHATAPYLHDGSAMTLREVLVDRNTNDEHGVTSHLTEAQLQQLERFLLELE